MLTILAAKLRDYADPVPSLHLTEKGEEILSWIIGVVILIIIAWKILSSLPDEKERTKSENSIANTLTYFIPIMLVWGLPLLLWYLTSR